MDDRAADLRNPTAVRRSGNAASNMHPLCARPAADASLKACGDRSLTGLEGDSDAIVRVRQLLRKLAPTGAGDLILGESDAGKKVAARRRHRLALECADGGAAGPRNGCVWAAQPALENGASTR